MYYIQPIANESGAFPAPQANGAPGLLLLPDAFLPEFFKEGKLAAGFVTIEHDGETVTACTWNEEAYQAYLATLPAPAALDPASLRERAYDTEPLVEWPAGSGTRLTVTEAAKQWQYYAAEGDFETADKLTGCIQAAKQAIREKYPDGA